MIDLDRILKEDLNRLASKQTELTQSTKANFFQIQHIIVLTV